ncbi:MAG: glucose 1-dehydrogenase [Candidatus Tectomicrobia bacterium]|uniref:Glucose 1-dehydrogenase n=1 Tax=Tectimicrobiota bacterium TaxID=2528274 RepID=A0A932CMP5_UNCTE|nr:glucose 1-dehydrogenase [Candidatus Tectomicrobia bacterium]
MRLENRVAIITGAAGAGIGQATARLLASEGANVVVSDVHLGRATQVAQEITSQTGHKAIGVRCDVSVHQEVDDMVQRTLDEFGRVDILVNNAAREILSPVVEMTDEQWQLVMDVCLTGTFYCTRAVLKSMIAQKRGAIVSLSSIVGWMGSDQGEAHYCAAKAAVVGFTKAVAREVAPHRVRVNAIAPGLIYNDFLGRIYPPSFFEDVEKQIPLGRRGEPNDIARTILFLVSDDSSYITGETICVSGGWYMP